MTLKRSHQFTELNRKHLAADQAQFIDEQWQRSNHAIVANPKYIKYIGEMQGYPDNDSTLRAHDRPSAFGISLVKTT